MLAPHIIATPPPCRVLTLTESALSMGLLNVGTCGSGKTTLLAFIALQHVRKGTAQVIIDPLGTLSEALLFLLLRSLQRVPQDKHAEIWRRISYIDVGSTETVTPFPNLHQTGRRKPVGHLGAAVKCVRAFPPESYYPVIRYLAEGAACCQ